MKKFLETLFSFLIKLPSIVLSGIILCYRLLISPLLPRACRFSPTCSEYALEALRQYGLFYGCFLTLKRLSRCHPWGKDGWDPVPKNKKN
jgi:hypothetical protein